MQNTPMDNILDFIEDCVRNGDEKIKLEQCFHGPHKENSANALRYPVQFTLDEKYGSDYNTLVYQEAGKLDRLVIEMEKV